MKQKWQIVLIAIASLVLVWLAGGGAEAMWQSSPPPPPTATWTPAPTWTPTATLTPTPTLGPAGLLPSALCGSAGEVVSVDGVNFRPNLPVSITWSGMALGTSPSPVQADPAGRIHFTFVVPNDYAGPHLVRASDGVQVAQFTFTLGGGTCAPPPTWTPPPASATPTETATATPTPTTVVERPRLVCEPDSAVPEQTITVHGENFHPGGLFYQLRWDGVVIPWAPNGLTVGDDGTFSLWFSAPSDTYELHTLVADDGQGGLAECYIDLQPRDPTPTWTPTPTLTPTPTATWTPGPPPRITVTPTLEPSPFEACAEMDAVFTRDPLVDTRISAGVVLTNTNISWPDNRMQLGLWQYYGLRESDTGVRFTLPGLAAGESLTLRQQFQTTQYAGPVWFQLRLLDMTTGQASVCTSSWFVLYVYDDEPYPPPLLQPPDDVWLNTRELTLDWLASGIPAGAGPVDRYEVQLMDMATGADLVLTQVGPDVTEWGHTLDTDYGARQLAWRARGHNAGGWGRWATAFYFGVDTVRPVADLAVSGTAGQDGWYISPLTVRAGGSDPVPGSGLTATYLQVGDGRWEQVIPGGANIVSREGEYFLRVYGRDRALNRSLVTVRPVKVDLTPPHRLAAVFSSEPTSSGWYTRPVTITLEAEDAVSGVGERRARLDGGPWQVDQVVVDTAGEHLVEYLARDVAGNETDVRQTTVRLDLSPPAGGLALNGSLCQVCAPAAVSVAAGDGQSGLAHWTLSLALPEAAVRVGLASPLGQTVLASGSEPAREVELAGADLPAGPLVLQLAVQDRAGWTTVEELVVENAGYTAGPTPTPWVMATATPWPTATPGSMPYVTITPTPTGTPVPGGSGGGSGNGGGGGDNNDGGGGTSSIPGSYPVGGTSVPVILPVTGQ